MLTRDYFSSSWWSYLTFGWMEPLLDRGKETSVLHPSDCACLGPAESTFDNIKIYSTSLDEYKDHSYPLIRAFVSTFWVGLLIQQAIYITSELIQTMFPLLLQQMLIFQEAQMSKEVLTVSDERWALFSAIGLLSLSVLVIIFSTQAGFYQVRLSTRMDQALSGSILMRCSNIDMSRGEKGKSEESKVFNVLNFDVGPNVAIIWVILEMVLYPFRIGLHGWLLYRQVGAAMIPGLTFIIALAIINIFLMSWDGRLRDDHLTRTDARMEQTQEVVENVRQIQLLERRDMIDRVHQAREEEFGIVWLRKLVQTFSHVLTRMVTVIVSLITFYVYIKKEGRMLHASLVMTVLVMFAQLSQPIQNIPRWIQTLLVWRSAFKRVNDYLHFKEPTVQTDVEQGGTQWVEPEYNLAGGVKSVNAIIGYPSRKQEEELLLHPTFTLHCGNFIMEPGSKIHLSGPRHSGKTCFLQSLCGNVKLCSGNLLLPRNVAKIRAATKKLHNFFPSQTQEYAPRNSDPYVLYAPQRPCVMRKTVKENILMGYPFVPTCYNQALECVCLQDEVACMPQTDDTLLVTKGENVSGGQAARIQLARVVYRSLVGLQAPTLVLLDAPYSNLDSTTARTIHSALFNTENGVFRDALVILVGEESAWTNSWRHFTIDSGDLVESRTSTSFLGGPIQWPSGTENPQEQSDDDMPSLSSSDGNDNNSRGESGIKRRSSTDKRGLKRHPTQTESFETEEHRNVGLVHYSIYGFYFGAMGYGIVLAVVMFNLCMVMFDESQDIFSGYWSDDKRRHGRHFLDTVLFEIVQDAWRSFDIYKVLVAGFCLFTTLSYFTEFLGTTKATRSIFVDTFNHLVRKPFLWWDENSQGRVFNRLCVDVRTLDDGILDTFSGLLYHAVKIVCHAVVLVALYWMTILWIPVAIYAYMYFASFYRPTIRELYRINRNLLSPVTQSCVEALVNVDVLQPLGATRWACWDALLNLDEYLRAMFTLRAVNLWLSLRLRILSFCVVAINGAYPIICYYFLPRSEAISAGTFGITIMYLKTLQSVLHQTVTGFSNMEMTLVSVERLHEWSSKDEGEVDDSQFMDPVVLDNSLQLDNVCVYYSTTPVLTRISFKLEHNDICIVTGRTGSGKSSLALALMRAIPYTGRMLLGRFEINQCYTRALRRRFVTVCPQHPVVFTGTYHFNIGPDKSEEDVCRAMRAVGLAENPNDEVVSPSVTDKQLISVARAIVRGYCNELRLVIFDEVTACIPEYEAAQFLNKMVLLMETSTRLIITHQHLDIEKHRAKRIHLDKGLLVN